MRVLILTCNTGQGHNSCAEALREVLLCRGDEVQVVDALGLISDGLSDFVAGAHVFMYRKAPGLFRKGYSWAEEKERLFREGSAVYRLLSQGSAALGHRILAKGYGAVLCAHPFAGIMLHAARHELPELEVKTALLATDYTCSPGVPQSGCDLYFIPHESLAGDFAEHGIPREKLRSCGIPVRKEFLCHAPKTDAKRAQGVAPEHKHLLMMCGSMGCGPMEALAEEFVLRQEDDMELSIVCGSNEELRETLRARHRDNELVHVRGYVEDMSGLMDSADLILTKPGGLSVTEAAAKALPMVLVDAVAGCEEHNLNFFVKNGAAVWEKTTEALAVRCAALLSDEAALAEMSRRCEDLSKPDAAERICRTLEEYVMERGA